MLSKAISTAASAVSPTPSALKPLGITGIKNRHVCDGFKNDFYNALLETPKLLSNSRLTISQI